MFDTNQAVRYALHSRLRRRRLVKDDGDSDKDRLDGLDGLDDSDNEDDEGEEGEQDDSDHPDRRAAQDKGKIGPCWLLLLLALLLFLASFARQLRSTWTRASTTAYSWPMETERYRINREWYSTHRNSVAVRYMCSGVFEALSSTSHSAESGQVCIAQGSVPISDGLLKIVRHFTTNGYSGWLVQCCNTTAAAVAVALAPGLPGSVIFNPV